jgi:hypothetical protein
MLVLANKLAKNVYIEQWASMSEQWASMSKGPQYGRTMDLLTPNILPRSTGLIMY